MSVSPFNLEEKGADYIGTLIKENLRAPLISSDSKKDASQEKKTPVGSPQPKGDDIKKDTEKDIKILNEGTEKNVGNDVVKFFEYGGKEATGGLMNFIDFEMGDGDIFYNRHKFNTMTGWDRRDDTPINVDGVSIRPGRLGNILLGYTAELNNINPIVRDTGSFIVAHTTLGSGKGKKEIIDRALYDAGRGLAQKGLSLENLKQAIKEGIIGRNKKIKEYEQSGRSKQPFGDRLTVDRFMKGMRAIHDNPPAIYIDTPEKRAKFSEAKPKLADLIQKLDGFERGEIDDIGPEDYESIKQSLADTLGYITK